jgi:hypothetical protein
MLSGPAASDPLTYLDHRDLHQSQTRIRAYPHPRAPNFSPLAERAFQCVGVLLNGVTPSLGASETR